MSSCGRLRPPSTTHSDAAIRTEGNQVFASSKANHLVRRLSSVREIAETTVRVLLADDGTSAPEADGEPRPEKVLSETALLLLFAARVDPAHTTVHRQIRSLAKQLVPHARSDRVLAGITLAPALAREYAAAHVCLSHLGHRGT